MIMFVMALLGVYTISMGIYIFLTFKDLQKQAYKAKPLRYRYGLRPGDYRSVVASVDIDKSTINKQHDYGIEL